MPSATGAENDRDRTGRARIRDAAIAEFGDHGVDGTSLKAIAERAGVSQPLIVHHFGSKQGLRAACDHHVASLIREQKLRALDQGPRLDPLAALREADNRHAMRYLARTLGDGTPEVAALLDELVEDALDYEKVGIDSGVIKPSQHPRERMVILVLWSMGLLMLHEQAERLLGVDLLGDPAQLGPYLLPAVEILAKGVVADEMYEHTRAALEHGLDAAPEREDER